MKTIRVTEVTGELCMTYEEGHALLEVLLPAVAAGGADLDFRHPPGEAGEMPFRNDKEYQEWLLSDPMLGEAVLSLFRDTLKERRPR